MPEPSQNIWERLFAQHRIARKMPEIGAFPDGATFSVNGHGTLRVFVMKTSAVGENYFSDTYTVKAETHDGMEHSAFVKLLPANPTLREGAYLFKVNEREIVAYRILMPQIEKFKRMKGIAKEQVPLAAPRAHYMFLDEFIRGVRDGMETVVVLEDLKLSGHRTANKIVGCDYQHASLTLQTLANFHAASVAYVRHQLQDNQRRNFPKELKIFHETVSFLQHCSEMIRSIIPLHLNILRANEMHKEVAWLEEDLLPNLETVVAFQDKLEDCGSLPAILHGDAWINNIMFRYQDDQVKAATLVDWQLVRFGHPSSDIVHFLFTSTTYETRAQHLDELLENYFTTLSSKLVLFGINLEREGYTFEKFRQDAEKRFVWGMTMALMVLPMILDTEVADRLNDSGSEHDSDAKEDAEDSQQKFRALFTSQSLLRNKFLCQRITEMVREVYQVVSKAE